jgi:CheY-like chemotaxis protein
VKDEVARRLQAEDALRQAQKMEAIGQLTGGIAHDFNNMLAVVTGALSLLERRLARGDTNVGRFIEGAMTGAQRATALTQRLLAFSRQQALTPEAVDVNALIENLAELLARTLGEKIEVKSVRAPDLWPAYVDVAQLESAILNLAVNSRDAMPGGGRLIIRTENADIADASDIPSGQYVVVRVIDEGAGMPPDVLSRAFEPFFTTKDVGKGSGLGLSQVFGFIRQSGGQMKLDSTPGKGTTAVLYLPRHTEERRPAAPEPANRETNGGQSTETVLVVEDDDRVRELSVEALKELGYNVIPAGSAAETLCVISRGERITLLFTDVVMPVVKGRQLADVAVRKLPGLKVLFTTGYDRDASIATGDLDAGAALIMKPFKLAELASKVRRTIDG